MSSATKNSRLVWLDLEMTGLDPIHDKIVEIATLITDKHLNLIEKGPNIIISQTDETLKNLNHWCQEHFTDSGLLEEISSSKTSLKEAEQKTLSFIKKHCLTGTAILAGNSVHIDKQYIFEQMPELASYLHHRIIDVNTIRELSLDWFPKITPFPRLEPHRAMGDALESLSELKYYKEHIFISDKV